VVVLVLGVELRRIQFAVHIAVTARVARRLAVFLGFLDHQGVEAALAPRGG
jgi:hypothetical protein